MGPKLLRPLLPLLLALVALTVLAPDSAAQRAGGKTRPFPALGVEFKPLKDMSDVPANDRLQRLGVVAQLDSKDPSVIKLVDDRGKTTNHRVEYPPSLKVARVDPPEVTTGEGVDDDPFEDIFGDSGPGTVAEVCEALFGHLGEIDLSQAEHDDSFNGSKGMEVERYQLEHRWPYGQFFAPVVLDIYVFQIDDFKLIMAWDYPADSKNRKKWDSAVRKSMKSVKRTRRDAEVLDVGEVNSESSYEDLLAFHTHDVEQTPGWRLVEVPSKQYLIKTNVPKKDKKDISAVISRIEAARALYERDFPPAREITSVSVIRICANRSDFNTYGQTGGGVAGYFSPRSEELVLFFDRSFGDDATLSVMTHEGFHQYCHFLFNRSEAHRWFDEGHGDYYGAFIQKGKRLVGNEDMEGGLARVPEIKRMFKDGTIKPLSEHIRFNHGQWQNQGPSNVSCYAQSFSLVYFLREGAEGNVSKKYWKKEYAEIIPNYMRVLDEGYQAAYAKIIEDTEESLKELEGDEEASEFLKEKLRGTLESPWDALGYAEKQEIWDDAMEASWGQVDETEFEERWLEFVDKVM